MSDVANQFGEQVPDEQAYRQAREACRFLTLKQMTALFVGAGPIQRRALVDEYLWRTLLPGATPAELPHGSIVAALDE